MARRRQGEIAAQAAAPAASAGFDAKSSISSVAAFEDARARYIERTIAERQMVEDAITGKEMDIEKQLLYLTFDAGSGGGLKLPKWEDVKAVKDFEPLLLAPTASRATGHHKAQPVLLRAEPGTGKSWSMLQLLLILAKRQRGASGAAFVPMLLPVQRLVRFWKPSGAKDDNLLLAFVRATLSGLSNPGPRTLAAAPRPLPRARGAPGGPRRSRA